MVMPEYALQRDDEGLPVRVTGALLKKGGSRRGRRRNWSKRFFVLDVAGGRLRYYEDQKLLQLSGATTLLPTTEVVVDEAPKLKGRHAPIFRGEDPFYFELRNTTDDKGRPRPFGFALRAFTEIDYHDWSRSLQFCVRQLKLKDHASSKAPPPPVPPSREAPDDDAAAFGPNAAREEPRRRHGGNADDEEDAAPHDEAPDEAPDEAHDEAPSPDEEKGDEEKLPVEEVSVDQPVVSKASHVRHALSEEEKKEEEPSFGETGSSSSEEVIQVTFEKKGSLGLSLNLSKDVAAGRRVVVCDETHADKGGGVAFRQLESGDELFAVQYVAGTKKHTVYLKHNPTKADFDDVTQNIRDCPRPLSLLFKRYRFLPHIAPTSTEDDDTVDDLDDDVKEDDLLDDDVKEVDSFYVLTDKRDDDEYAQYSVAQLCARWRDGLLAGDSRVYVDDAWVTIDSLPDLKRRLLRDDGTTSSSQPSSSSSSSSSS